MNEDEEYFSSLKYGGVMRWDKAKIVDLVEDIFIKQAAIKSWVKKNLHNISEYDSFGYLVAITPHMTIVIVSSCTHDLVSILEYTDRNKFYNYQFLFRMKDIPPNNEYDAELWPIRRKVLLRF